MPDAPGDNNRCERGIKTMSWNRRNSPGCKTMPGAQGERDGIVSRMHTCQLAGISPAAVPSPAKWLPWDFPKAAVTTNQTRLSRHGVKSTAAPAPRTLDDPIRCSPVRRGFVDAAKLAPLHPLPAEVLDRFQQLQEVNRESPRHQARPRSGWHEGNTGAWRAGWRSVSKSCRKPNWPRPAIMRWASGAGWKSICRTGGGDRQ